MFIISVSFLKRTATQEVLSALVPSCVLKFHSLGNWWKVHHFLFYLVLVKCDCALEMVRGRKEKQAGAVFLQNI